MEYSLGIDIGSRTIKGVLVVHDSIKAYRIIPSGINYVETAELLKRSILEEVHITNDDKSRLVATGFGAEGVIFCENKLDELRSCARGINFICPDARTVIDIGGMSSRVIRIDENGRIVNFAVSEKCAAGSGYFMEILANVLRMELSEIGPLSLKSKKPVSFTTGCAVFNESEAVCMVAEGFSKEDILAGMHKAMAVKLSGLIDRIGLVEPCAICGGGGLNVGLIGAIESEMKSKLLVPDQPQIVSALGAALSVYTDIKL